MAKLPLNINVVQKLLLFTLLGPAVAAAAHLPTCGTVTKKLYGVELGPVQHFPSGLRTGLIYEGTAELIADVGFESLEGSTDGVTYPRILAFFDRGQFTGITAIGRVASVEPTKWDDGPAIEVRVMDQSKLDLTRTYMAEYCADPSRRRPKDACK